MNQWLTLYKPLVYIPVVNQEKTAIVKACQFRGSQKKLAIDLGVSEQAISKWKKRGVPAERVLEIERVTGGAVTRYELRPDLYPLEEVA